MPPQTQLNPAEVATKDTTTKAEDEDEEDSLDEDYGDSQQGFFIHLLVIISALGGFLYGYDTCIISGALVFVKRHYALTTIWQELVVSATILGAWFFSMTAGLFSGRFGRKLVIMAASLVFVVGSLMMGFAWDKWSLMAGRAVVGMGIGLSSATVPLYIAEVAPTKVRGSLLSMNTCFINLGILAAAITAGAFSYDHLNGWRWMLSLGALPASLQFLGFLWLPESPRWLMAQRREKEALESLKLLRGPQTERKHLMREFEMLLKRQTESEVAQSERQRGNIMAAVWRNRGTRRALFIGCCLHAFQQLAGINTLMYYTATILEMTGVKSQSLAVWMTVPTTTVYFIATFCGYLVADRLNRRTIVLGSLGGVIVSLCLLGTGFYMTSNFNQQAHGGLSLNTWLVFGGLIIFLASFAPGMSGMPWTINSELYPMWARGFCFSITAGVHWLFNMLISLSFISLTELLSPHGAFYMYAVISAIGWLLIYRLLPETRGRSLDDVDTLFLKKTDAATPSRQQG